MTKTKPRLREIRNADWWEGRYWNLKYRLTQITAEMAVLHRTMTQCTAPELTQPWNTLLRRQHNTQTKLNQAKQRLQRLGYRFVSVEMPVRGPRGILPLRSDDITKASRLSITHAFKSAGWSVKERSVPNADNSSACTEAERE